MASPTATSSSQSNSTGTVATVERIGVAAGEIWQFLNNQGPQSITKLINSLESPRDTVLQAIGWLAREGKIHIDDDSRTRIVSLK